MRAITLLILLASLSAVASADTVVLRDRTILQGKAERRGDRLAVAGRVVPLDEVLVWEDDRQLARDENGFPDQRRGYETLGRRAVREACGAAFEKAVEAGARESARRILAMAVRCDLPAKDAVAWGKRIDKMKATAGAETKVPGTDLIAGVLAKRAQVALDHERELRGWEILRAALHYDRNHEEALALLEEIAPARWRIGHFKPDDDDAYKVQRLWLDWQVDVLRGKVRPLGRLAPDVARARNRWRKDLNGVETREEGAEIVFITPLNRRTEIVGKCVRYAKITCRALGQMFHTDKPRREDNEPLVIYFYESRDEYIRKAGNMPPGKLAMTAGFYTPGENISRFFWPTNRVDVTNAVRNTFVHELTHHWIERRNPRWHASELAGLQVRVLVPGYWIGEGFATFVQEGRYDIENFTWSHFNPKANSIDIVAALSKEKKLIDWTKVYTLSQAAFHGAGLGTNEIYATAKKRWGVHPQPLNEIRLFYEQSATTCHYLYWAEKGKYRQRLLDYVTSFYTSQKDKTAIEAAFGCTEEELGERVEAWAKAVIHDGWKPE